MNKIDLIIEAIRLAEYHVKAKSWGDDIDLELYTAALAAARELKALKPVAMVDHRHAFSDGSIYMIANYERSLPSGTKLYALVGEQA